MSSYTSFDEPSFHDGTYSYYSVQPVAGPAGFDRTPNDTLSTPEMPIENTPRHMRSRMQLNQPYRADAALPQIDPLVRPPPALQYLRVLRDYSPFDLDVGNGALCESPHRMRDHHQPGPDTFATMPTPVCDPPRHTMGQHGQCAHRDPVLCHVLMVLRELSPSDKTVVYKTLMEDLFPAMSYTHSARNESSVPLPQRLRDIESRLHGHEADFDELKRTRTGARGHDTDKPSSEQACFAASTHRHSNVAAWQRHQAFMRGVSPQAGRQTAGEDPDVRSPETRPIRRSYRARGQYLQTRL